MRNHPTRDKKKGLRFATPFSIGFHLIRIWTFACLLICSSVLAQGTSPVPKEIEKAPTFKVLSWNIYMLPWLAKTTGKRMRAHAIGDLLAQSDYDLIVFQEAFLGSARRILSKNLTGTFPYSVGPANRKFSIRTNSGIWILSRTPLTHLEEIDYTECAGFDDCFARKGALLASTFWQGKEVQVLGTHLQAGGPDSIRHSQYREMKALLDRHAAEGVPQLVCGDMNTRRSDAENYAQMMSCLEAEDGPLTGQQQFTADGVNNDLCGGGAANRKVIDYVFLRKMGVNGIHLKRWVPLIRSKWARKHLDLSDHFPVGAELFWWFKNSP